MVCILKSHGPVHLWISSDLVRYWTAMTRRVCVTLSKRTTKPVGKKIYGRGLEKSQDKRRAREQPIVIGVITIKSFQAP